MRIVDDHEVTKFEQVSRFVCAALLGMAIDFGRLSSAPVGLGKIMPNPPINRTVYVLGAPAPVYRTRWNLQMKIKVLRNACCAADDQLGPLTMDVELDGLMPLRALVDLVLESDFLQYSSSHTSMVGYVDRLAVVRVHSPDYSKEETQFLVNPKLPIQEAVASGSIDFRF